MGFYSKTSTAGPVVGNGKSRGEVLSAGDARNAPSRHAKAPAGKAFCAVGSATFAPDALLYGYRHLSTVLGRWVSRDPQNEIGALSVIHKDIISALRMRQSLLEAKRIQSLNQIIELAHNIVDSLSQNHRVVFSLHTEFSRTPDVLAALMAVDPNLYLFVVNNPMFFVDIDGRDWWPPWKWPIWPKPTPPAYPRDRVCEIIDEINRRMHGSCFSANDLSNDEINVLPIPDYLKRQLRIEKCKPCTICLGCEILEDPRDPRITYPVVRVGLGCSF